MSSEFEIRLQRGRTGESLVACWLRRQGCSILPAGEFVHQQFGGPRILSPQGDIVAPDMFAFGAFGGRARAFWCEVKRKTAFSWHRYSRTWVDGIDEYLWKEYLRFRHQMKNEGNPWDLWLLFLHPPGGLAKDTPPGMVPPTGLFGGEVYQLWTRIHHRAADGGNRAESKRAEMVYWAHDCLTPLASYEEVADAARS